MSLNDEQNTEIEVLKSIYWEDFKGTIVIAQYFNSCRAGARRRVAFI
jgi:hypothetical protein